MRSRDIFITRGFVPDPHHIGWKILKFENLNVVYHNPEAPVEVLNLYLPEDDLFVKVADADFISDGKVQALTCKGTGFIPMN